MNFNSIKGFNKLTAETFTSRLGQAHLVRKNDIDNFVNKKSKC